MPAEVEFCNLLGLSEEEYWYFVQVTESYNGKRPPAYDLIPNVGMDFTGGFLTNLIVGLVLTGVSVLLSPKPRAINHKTPPSLKTADVQGTKRFAPQTGFGSIQELAALGEVIPLVFTNTAMNPNGGIRVNSKLLWSQMRSLFTGQQLRGLFLFSSGQLGAMPDYEGFAIGDTTLANYTEAKVALYFMTEGGRPKERNITGDSGNTNERYNKGTLGKWPDNDAFSVWWDDDEDYNSDIFSGTRTPGTQTQFGAFAPFPNGSRFMLPYELILKGKDAKEDVKKDIDTKREKIEASYPRYTALVRATNSSGNNLNEDKRQWVYKNYKLYYQIDNTNPVKNLKQYKPWGVDDVKAAVDSTRSAADSNLANGDTYLVGSALATCDRVSYSDDQGIWTPGNKAVVKARFNTIEKGKVDIKEKSDTDQCWKNLVIQRCAIGTVTTNTSCDVTEIGIKSTVWKQVTSFPNVNSHPGHIKYGQPGTVKNYEDDNGSIQLGNMSKYITRLSLFRLQARIAGKNVSWKFIDGGIPFVVRGNTPQPQYNFIRINHDRANQYEFRFVPYPGNLAVTTFRDKDVHLMRKDRLDHIEAGAFDIYYSGELTQLTGNLMSNPDWYLGDLPELTSTKVTGFNKNKEGNIPTHKDWVKTVSNAYESKDEGRPTKGAVFTFRGGKGAYSTINFYYPGHQYMSIQTEWPWWKRSGREPWDGYTPPLPKGLDKADQAIDNAKYVYRDGPFQFRVGAYVSTSGSYSKVYKINKYEKKDVPDPSYPVTTVSTTSTGDGTGLTLRVTVYKNKKNAVEWEIKNAGSGYEAGDKITFTVPHVSNRKITCSVDTDSDSLVEKGTWPNGGARNLNRFDAIADYYQYDAEQSSHLSGPEHEIVYVNEQVVNNNRAGYSNLAIAGLRLNSAKEWSSFSQLSAYIQEGIKVDRLITSGEGATNLFPEIAYALLTDDEIGAGDLIGVSSVDKDKMTIAAKFCKANGFFWDGVITDSQNLRDFIFVQAAYCFLDFTIIGGRFSLYPSVPFNSQHKIHDKAKPEIKALFTDGNIKDLKVSFLSPEERQVFQARVLWREETKNGFAQTKVHDIRLSDSEGGSSSDPRETFDMSNFCTTSDHAAKFGRYALRTRQLVDHGLKFQTTPQAAMFLTPGDYFRLYSESTHTSRFSNGVISPEGVIQSQTTVSSGDSVYYWKPGGSKKEEVKGPTPLTLVDGLATSKFRGCVFTIAQTDVSDRVYKLESLTFAEDGLVEVAGSYVPLTSDGYLAVLHQYDGGTDFVEVG